MKRPSKNTIFMEIATVISQLSHDAETKVGSVLISNKNQDILGMGYNGFVRGADDSILPNTRPEKYKYIVHSEENLICNLVSNGKSSADSTLYVTMSPCVGCMRKLYQARVTKIICKEKYRDFESLKEMLDLKIEESLTPEGYFVLEYKVK